MMFGRSLKTVTIYGNEYRPTLGARVKPDNWNLPNPLLRGDDFSSFRIETFSLGAHLPRGNAWPIRSRRMYEIARHDSLGEE